MRGAPVAFWLLLSASILAVASTEVMHSESTARNTDMPTERRPRTTHVNAGAAGSLSPNDSTLEAARAALAAGRPWLATRLLAPIVSNEASRSPAVVLVAATAAAEWGGWQQVDQLLAAEPWVDSLFDGRARVLLARAALTRPVNIRLDSTALVHARLAMASAPDSFEESVRLVLLAGAFERAGRNDSARAAYARAAVSLPMVSDWLRLRAAALTVDSADRARAYAMLRTDVARARIAWTEAAAREHSGDVVAAARMYVAVGAPVAALRLRLATARDDSTRRAIRRDLVALIQSRSGSSLAREAVTVLDVAFAPLTGAEHLAVARSAARSGPGSRAASGFAAAFRRGLGTRGDRYTYAKVLSGLRRDREAAAQFALVTSPPTLAASAAYQRARSLLRSGAETEARAALHAVSRTYAADTGAASSALFLLADLAADNRRDDVARATFLDVGRRYPTSQLAPRALFRAALIAFVADSIRAAAEEFDAIRSRYPRDGEATAALYWAGRAWERVGDVQRARRRWNEVIARDRLSYYTILSARRLGAAANLVSEGASLGNTVGADAVIDSAMNRAALLQRLNMSAEARYEYEWLEENAAASPVSLVATASAFAGRGLAARAIALGRRAVADGTTRDATTYRLIYPLAYEDALTAEAARHGLDPAFVAALIRQESQFTPWATSGAGARGLMQIMPEVGREIATARAFPVWNTALLYQPDVSLELGTAHLAGLERDYARPEHVLAAYNAGRSRVARWLSKPGTGDPEVFVERIPFKETRDYVRIVLRNRAMYQALYSRLQGPQPSRRDMTVQ